MHVILLSYPDPRYCRWNTYIIDIVTFRDVFRFETIIGCISQTGHIQRSARSPLHLQEAEIDVIVSDDGEEFSRNR